MNYDIEHMRAALQAAQIRRAFVEWLAADSDCLASAASLLGGGAWEKRAREVEKAIREDASPEDVQADLVALHRLLTLQFTNNLDSIESIHFMDIHPDDPRADDARLCAEALERGLDAMRILATTVVREVA